MPDEKSTRQTPRSKPLTQKQAAFRDAILAGFHPSDAYKKAFDAKGMSKKAISVEAAKLLRDKRITLAITLATKSVTAPAVLPEPSPPTLISLQRRMEELGNMALLDPLEMFDDLNHFKSIRDMPEHIRRCIQSFKVDPVSFVLEVKVHDKQTAIMNYSKLAGDIPTPKDKAAGNGPTRPRYDLSKLTDEEFKEHMRLRKKAMIQEQNVNG